MEEISRAIAALSSLIAANYKRLNFYHSLSLSTKDAELQLLCRRHCEQSKRFIHSLSTWRAAFGGFRTSGKEATAGTTWSRWKDLLDLALGKSTINRCELMEKEVLKGYKSAGALPFMPRTTVDEIELQAKDFEKALLHLKMLNERTHWAGRATSSTAHSPRSA
jgi:hypothetical protein